MESEVLTVFDDQRNPIGRAERGDVHRLGLWHETFHCWFISKEPEKVSLYLQLRSADKKDYPNLLDITAAGHLLESENVRDGIREVKEEIGFDISYDDLKFLGIVEYCAASEGFIDNEFAHVYLHEIANGWDGFTLQKEEVSGMVKVDFYEFQKLWKSEQSTIRIEGFQLTDESTQVLLDKVVDKDAFVPHGERTYTKVLNLIEKAMFV